MAKERTQYQCPLCDADMTEKVYVQCAMSSGVFRTFRVEVGVIKSKGARAKNVMLQCPNGHWADYPCPITGGV